MILGFQEKYLESKNALVTGKEIEQQPELWLETLSLIKNSKEGIERFLKEIDLKNSKIIFTGAGTSEFVGNSLVSYLRQITGLDMEARATTDIVANPKEYIPEEKRVVLVSFARSGNSPESVAAIDIANQVSKDIYHIIITCNSEGKLAQIKSDKSLVLLMPKKSNDSGFAMTGSFSCMLLSAYIIFRIDILKELEKEINELSLTTKKNILQLRERIFNLSLVNIERAVFLGSGTFKGIAQESSLKLLELCAGKIPVIYDTPLGFRHGPKSIINSETIIFNFINPDNYAKKYDKDLIKELKRDKNSKALVVISGEKIGEEETIEIETGFKSKDKILVGLNYIVISQIFAFMKSIQQGCTPDNPCPTGEVNRVVQGVIIHKY